MAEVLLADAARARRRTDAAVASAGVRAEPGWPASEGSVAAMSRRGLDLSGHRSRPVDDALLDASDLVVTMESRHVVDLAARRPDVLGRLFTLRELVAATEALPAEAEVDLAARLGPIAAARPLRAHLGRTDLDVTDPIGGSRAQYRRCAATLDELCERLADWMWGQRVS